jgi:energy-coupling factor transporter ATP-binding protein EcfA2
MYHFAMSNPLLAIHTPPDTVPTDLPVETRARRLPFEALTWQNFERLCLRLTAQDANVEFCSLYGVQGEAQEGIDIFARQADGHYHCLQAKRHRNYGAPQLRQAVDLFLDGSWADRAARFTIAAQASFASTAVQEEIERQANRLKVSGIRFVALDGDNLTELLRDHPTIIDDFFGRPWVAAMLGPDVSGRLGRRLDGVALALVRQQLARVYEAQFHFVDPGSFGSVGDDDGSGALTLLERFSRPEMLVRESRSQERAEPAAESGYDIGSPTSSLIDPPLKSLSGGTVVTSLTRRQALAEWLSDGDRLVVLGEAGCGKSTLLRVIAMDLLNHQTYFPELVTRWGQRTPIYIPFARWSSLVAREGSQMGVKEILRLSLEQNLTSSIVDLLDRSIDDGRVLLLIDGLDEWGLEQAARSTLSTLVTTVEAHGIPVVVSGRPRGLGRIGQLPAHWKRGSIAPLSVAQQTDIAGRWFGRYAGGRPSATEVSDGSLRTNRFMGELAREPSLGALATIPLLLIGLITLALRSQILPRTRRDVYNELVRLLIEVHPTNRATASGDTESRFRYAIDPDQRRAALAKLAFANREGISDIGLTVSAARDILRAYLASPQGFDLSDSDASNAASEMLSVNAETQGLIVEKAPNEVGFVHASFEEFLSAEHIGGWPFHSLEAFVRAHSGDGRWRNVLVNVLCGIVRRDEFNQLISTIEEPEPDETLRFYKDALLGDIAFAAATRSPSTAKRLAIAAMDRVETDDWLPIRREALSSVLKGLPDPALKPEIESRLSTWIPGRDVYRSAVISELGLWNPSEALESVLMKAMHDEDRSIQHAAAAAYAKVFAPSADACQRLKTRLTMSRDLTAATAILESLAIGWPHDPGSALLFEDAYHSHRSELRLVGILGLAESGTVPDEARKVVLNDQNFWSDISHPYRGLAIGILLKYCSDDNTLVSSALHRVSGNFDSLWEHDAATAYLMESSTERPDVRAWILTQFKQEFPFNVMNSDRIWARLGHFAKVDPEIRSAANKYWCEAKHRLINIRHTTAYVAQVADRQVAEALISLFDNKDGGPLHRHWLVSALITGWRHDDPVIKPTIDQVINENDEDILDLVALIPKLISDKAEARARLLRIGALKDVRRDLLAIAFEACGCDYTDDAAVLSMLTYPDQLSGFYNAYYPLFRAFGKHPRVRALAEASMQGTDGPVTAVAAGYKNDSEFADIIFKSVTPLPVDLRAQIIEVAATGAAGTALEDVIGRFMLETDPELRVRMAIAYHRSLPNSAREAAKTSLLAQAVAVGSEYEATRASALAGIVTIGRLDALVALEDHGKPVALEAGNNFTRIPTVKRLICERFADFESAFGENLSQRFKSFGNESPLAEILSVAPGASPAARAAFIALAERGMIPRTSQALRALAAVRPRSDLLLARCLDLLNTQEARNDQPIVNAEIGIILREQFPDDTAVRQCLIDQFTASPSTSSAITLAVFAPDAETLPLITNASQVGRQFGEWTVAIYSASRRVDAQTFCALLEAMLMRPWRHQFDAQPISNLAIDERLQSDPELQSLLAARIAIDVHPSISGSFARYLAAAGKLNSESRRNSLFLLQALGRDQRLPTAGYDAFADQWRATRATLLDAVTAGLDLP